MSFMVFVDGKTAPRKEHETEEEARAEAERLSVTNPDRYVYLLELVDVLEPVKHHRWRGKPTTGNPPVSEPFVIPTTPPCPQLPRGLETVAYGPIDIVAVYYGCQVIGTSGEPFDSDSTIKWYGGEDDNDD